MNYTFKLSRRLARFRAARNLVVANTLLILACSSDQPTGPGAVPSNDPTRVTIAPDSVSIGINQTLQFQASIDSSTGSTSLLSTSNGGKGRGRGRRTIVDLSVAPQPLTVAEGAAARFTATATLGDGSTLEPSVTWTATGGTIDASGTYTAGQILGNFAVSATDANGLSDTATVLVTETLPIVADISLSPTSATLPVGGSQQFVVVGKSSDGTMVAVNPRYVATGGTISSNGVYQAAQTPGTFRVIATDTLTNLADTAAVIIEAPPPILQAVVLSPASASLVTGATQQFAASGKMSDGSTSQVTVTWSASGGTISSAGLYTAGSVAGSYRVIATQTGSTLADTSAVTIAAPSPTLQAVVVTPASVSLLTGGTQQFTASGKMSDGSTSAVSVTWNASGGTISSAGLYTAGLTAGSYRVIASASGKADTSAVTITAPSLSGITIAPGESWQAKVNANPAGTVFRILAGTHQNQTVTPKTGNQFIGDVGAIMDGGLTTAFAFRTCSGCTGSTIASNVVIKGLHIKRYNPGFQNAAVQMGGNTAAESSVGWRVENCEIDGNLGGMAIRIGHSSRVLKNFLHHNGSLGMGGIGDNTVVDSNEISFNNVIEQHATGNEAGGTKFVRTNNLIVRNNYVHDNRGFGLWTDGYNVNVLYDGNRVEDNYSGGIFHEISYSAVIRNNTVLHNGLGDFNWGYGAGIGVASSNGAEVYGNTVTDNARGIVGIGTVRSDSPPGDLQNLYVHDNTVTMHNVATDGSGVQNGTGIVQDAGDLTFFTGKNNRFVHNTYYLGTAANYFFWQNGMRNETQWVAYGQDVTGTFTR